MRCRGGYTFDHIKCNTQDFQIGKHLAIMSYMDCGYEKFTTDWLCNWVNIKKKQVYPKL